MAICVQTAAGNICFTFVAYAFILIHEEVASFYAVYSQFFIQLYLYIFAIIAYFDVIISTAEFYGITSSYLSCCTVFCCYCPAFTNFGCQIIYFFVGCVQLAKVYCIFRFSAVCYILDSAVTVKGILVNLNIAAIKANATCASACASDGLNTSQSGVQCQAVAINYEVRVILQLKADFQCSIFYGRSNTICTLNLNRIAQSIGNFAAFIIFQTEGLVTDISINAVLYVIQLAAVYCISRACSDCAICYAGNFAASYI